MPRAEARSAPLNPSVTGYLAVLLAAAWWATSGLFVKYIAGQANVSPIILAFWRDLLTFLTLLISVGLLRPAALRIRRDDLPRLVAMGASLGAFHVFWNLAVLLNGAAVATVQQAATPAIVVVIARLVWRESLTWRKALAIVLAFLGTVLVSGIGAASAAQFTLVGPAVGFGAASAAQFTLVGLAVGFCLPLGYAGWTVFGKSVRGPYNPLVTLTYGFAFGALTLLPLQFFLEQPWSAPTSMWLGFVGWVAQTIIAFGAYIFGLGKLQVGIASILAMTEIAFVGLFAYFLLGERLTSTQLLGVALVVAGVLLLAQRQNESLKQQWNQHE